MLLLTLKQNLEIFEITVTKYKLIFIKGFVQLKFSTLKFILDFSIHPKILVSNTKWFSNKINYNFSSSILN